MELKVYMAGPLFTFAEQKFNNELAFELERHTFDTQLPQYFCVGIKDPREIAEMCLSKIVESDAMVVNCDGTDVESGTAFEAGYARGVCDMPIIAYRTDFRRGGDSDGLWPVNLMIGSHVRVFYVEPNFTKLVQKLVTALARVELSQMNVGAASIIANWPKWKRRIVEEL